MSSCHVLILHDDFDFQYVNCNNLDNFVNDFIEQFDFKPDQVGRWYGGVVFCIDKLYHKNEELISLIKKHDFHATSIGDIETDFEYTQIYPEETK